jgi:hypothetical protein
MSEHRASFEKRNADAEPVAEGRRLAFLGQIPCPGLEDKQSNRSLQGVRRSIDEGMCAKENRRNTGDPQPWGGKIPTGTPRGEEAVAVEVGGARNSKEASNERRAKGPWFQGNVTSKERAEIGENLPPPTKLWELQETLHAKAKGTPEYRFYALYDKIYRLDVLAEAWRRCRANAGAPGVDGVRFEDVEAKGVSRWIGQLAQELPRKLAS